MDVGVRFYLRFKQSCIHFQNENWYASTDIRDKLIPTEPYLAIGVRFFEKFPLSFVLFSSFKLKNFAQYLKIISIHKLPYAIFKVSRKYSQETMPYKLNLDLN